MAHEIKTVLVAGAGPVGLLTALMLARNGITVEVVEPRDKVNDAPRGLAYGPPAVQVLRRAGILGMVIERGLIPQDLSWRKFNGDYIAGLAGLDSLDPKLDPTVVLPVGSLSLLLIEELAKEPCATIHWEHKVVNVGQDAVQAWFEVDHNGEAKRLCADFVIGCDGAGSGVRKSLFGGRFPGYTWNTQLVALNIYYDFEKYGWSDAQWIIDPERWFMVARITKDGLWRISYGDPVGLSFDEINSRVAENLRTRLPGNPGPEDYRVTLVAPFSIHQRCAEKMRVGRVLLAGDAAHLNNTMGGLGLTTGISDVGSLMDCLLGIHTGQASIDILDLYDTMRRKIFMEITHEMSTTNLLRMMTPIEDVLANDPFFDLVRRARADPEFAKQLLKHDLSIGCDLTQFYKPKVPRALTAVGIQPKVPTVLRPNRTEPRSGVLPGVL